MMAIHKIYLPMALCAAALLAALAGCDNMVTMDQLVASITGDITGVAPRAVLSQGATQIASGGQYDIGSAVADGMTGNFVGSTVTFTITNGGGSKSSLTVNSVSLSGANASDFSLSAPGATTLAYNASVVFTLTFDPATTGSKSATLTIESTDSSTPSYAFTVNGTGAAFSVPSVAVPGATGTNFTLGWSGGAGAGTEAAVNPHVVTLTDFNIAEYEITYDQWSKVAAWAAGHGYTFAHTGTKGDGRVAATAQEPVTTISWKDTVVWCNAASELAGLQPCYYTTSVKDVVFKDATDTTTAEIVKADTTDTNACADFSKTGYRLPTEAEWEYSARAQTGTTAVTDGDRPAGDTTHSPTVIAWDNFGWHVGLTPNQTRVGGLKNPSGLGIYDMGGNVYEWCWDWHSAYVAGTVADPMGLASASASGGTTRVFRGGSWNTLNTEMATSYRDGLNASGAAAVSTIGFRIVWR